MKNQRCLNSRGVIFAGLVPHAPILIPPLGRQRLDKAAPSVATIKLVAARLTETRPDAVIFKMRDKPPTSPTTLEKARGVARFKGLRYVYTGNTDDLSRNSTRCSRCQRILIERDRYEIGAWNLIGSRCPMCNCAVRGRFAD